VLDFNANKQVVGIEVLDLKRRVPEATEAAQSLVAEINIGSRAGMNARRS